MPSSSQSAPWKLRALRFDFPREDEAHETIRQLVEFAQQWQYNALVLHFEGVVRTRSLWHLSAETTYSPDQMSALVDLAGAAGLEVIPVVGTLGHAEHLVEGPELRPLLKVGPNYKHLFCPSSDAVYERLDDYFTELTELFPGQNIHIGGDESWALGACPTCRERLRRGEASEDLFIAHLLRLHRILHQLGKRTWMWDDAFEGKGAEKIAQIPRDVIICSDATRAAECCSGEPTGECKCSPFHHYLDFGFEVVVCPWARSIDNISQLTEVAREDHLLGGMVTVWDLTTSFWPAFLPGAAYAGLLWAEPDRDPNVALQDALHALFPSLSEEAWRAVWNVVGSRFWNSRPVVQTGEGLPDLEEQRNLFNLVQYEASINRALKALPIGLERSILTELHTHVRLQVRAGKERGAFTSAPETDPGQPPAETGEQRGSRLLSEGRSTRADAPPGGTSIEDDEDVYIPPPTPPERAVVPFPGQDKDPVEAMRHRDVERPGLGRALLTVRLSLATAEYEPTLKIELGHGDVWSEIYLGTFKPFNSFVSVYNFQMPLSWKASPPDRVRFTVWNAGQKGILYAWLSLHERTLQLRSPSEIAQESGGEDSILVDSNGASIHGFPNSLRKASEGFDDGRSVVEMILV